MKTPKDQHYDELLILKTIAETLNQSNDMEQMLQKTLMKLLELTQMQTGWIFLLQKESVYELSADHRLPPALSRDDKNPMRCSDCLCQRLYVTGGLNQAVTIIECERLYNAITQCTGETHNLTHHATTPITVRGERLGLLNVGSPGKEHFSKEELTLLESVAYQLGTAIERVRLYEQKEKQAVDDISRFIINYYTIGTK
ncbi:GAF domain-containing protein [Marinicrinis lubricantis]|uniref:GAF domain-containing protein n=1 Tax=Marinicrinis lubricantis TaxID=2086470 RepID=A0ABW1IK13_9BACL